MSTLHSAPDSPLQTARTVLGQGVAATDQGNRGGAGENSVPRMVSASSFRKSAAVLSTSNVAKQASKMTRDDSSEIDSLMKQLSNQTKKINQQGDALIHSDDGSSYSRNVDFSTSSVPITPATDFFGSVTGNTTPAVEDGFGRTASPAENPLAELARMKAELAEARGKVARLEQEKEQEVVQNLIARQTLDSVLGASETDCPTTKDNRPETHQHNAGSLHIPSGRDKSSWMSQDDNRSENSEPLSARGFERSRAIWGTLNRQQADIPSFGNVAGSEYGAPQAAFLAPNYASRPSYGQQYSESGNASPVPFYNHPGNSEDMMLAPPRLHHRGGRFNGRNVPSQFSSGSSYDGYQPGYNAVPSVRIGGPSALYSAAGYGQAHSGGYGQAPSAIGTSLSPHAPEFSSETGAWKSEVSGDLADGFDRLKLGTNFTKPAANEGQTYIATTEPINYRRLLDRTASCNWKHIVDKIVCSNDQQASIFLQQKLKVGTPDQKYDIVEAIVAQAYPLMINRFGNFLVQRCFEHGVPEQVIKIAEAIRGNTLNLSMDAFGCHVVQKAFDSVPEDYKALMVHELLRRIPETVIHRYACHVWQKLFELRWVESPPQIMQFVNEALQGMWHEVALGETGSLVVQNIFENCLEGDKRPCIEEVLASIDIVAHGQFGNWCIQHICEHGAPADRSRAVDHVIRYASEYSRDQYASKVVEKCLKIGGVDFLSRYLDRVCEGRLDRPRIPLIDIASDQYGNYLIQYILTHANPQHREMVASHIRKHMVSLRGSKFGSRVGMLCTNPAFATRPGPGVGPGVGPVGIRPPQNSRFGGAYR